MVGSATTLARVLHSTDREPCSGPQGKTFSGAAYLFDTTTGTQLFKFTPTVPVQGGEFGHAVALGGGLAAVTSLEGPQSGSGSVSIYDSSAGTHLHTLSPPLPGIPGEEFGLSVEIQGGRVFVGAPRNPFLGIASGSVYVYDGATGSLQAQLMSTSASNAPSFGTSLSVDGSRIAVGAPGSNTSGWQTGSVFVYEIPTWQLVTQLVQKDPPRVDLHSPVLAGGTGFGLGLDYAAGQIVVGAPTDSDQGRWAGSVFLFDDVTQNTGSGGCYTAGSPQACLCGTQSHSSGCGNSAFGTTLGAILYGSGDAQFANDTLVLSVSHLPPGTAGLFVYGASQTPVPLGEGLLCTAGTMRFPVQTASLAGSVQRTGLSANASAGQTLTYQFWYRDLVGLCSSTQSNVSNSWTVTW